MAHNEAALRDMNEQIEQAQPRASDDYLRILCECGRPDCARLVAISIAEYESVRSDARHFIVVGTHVMADVEDIVRETDRFTVVCKHEGTPAQIAEDEDPRS